VEKYGRAGLAAGNNVAHALSGWLTKATLTHAEYVILISFPRQQWLRERASVLRLYVRRLVKKYPHWCFNVQWVGGTAFCAHMLTDSTFVSACGKFQHHHTV